MAKRQIYLPFGNPTFQNGWIRAGDINKRQEYVAEYVKLFTHGDDIETAAKMALWEVQDAYKLYPLDPRDKLK